MAAVVTACGSLNPPAPATEAQGDALAADTPTNMCNRNARPNIDTYKIGVARHILRSNLGHTVDDDMPQVLPASVVVRLSVDRFGKISDVAVQRTRDDTAAEEAVASIRRSGTFPLPCGLIARPDGKLTFFETFLFNRQYQFQLRSLANTP
jgi:protein TonB